MSNNVKIFKKGEILFKEGDKAASVFVIQSGSVSTFIARAKHNIEMFQVGPSQIVGEAALSGANNHNVSAMALNEVKAIEVPIDPLKAQIEGGSQLLKLVTKSLSDKLKMAFNEIKSSKLAGDSSPCPQDQTAKIFGVIWHTAMHKGESKPEVKEEVRGGKKIEGRRASITVAWHPFKQYAQRVFLENPKRLEQAINVIVKLGLASYEMVKPDDDPEGPDEIGFVHFWDLAGVEQFFEFFQYYYFKGGKQDFLRAEENSMRQAMGLLEVASGAELDRHGAVRLDFPKTVEAFKGFGLPMNNDQIGLLETKGLFVKRQADDRGAVWLSFDLAEFKRTLTNWKFLREIEKWNEKGHIDPNEPFDVALKKLAPGAVACPGCSGPIEGSHKFCPNCGHKIQAAA